MRGWPAKLTFKGVVGTMLREFIPKLNSRRLELFRETTFRIFIGMPTPNGDPMLFHLMMLHEVRYVVVARVGGLIGRDTNTCIPSVVFVLAGNVYNWNRFAWSAFLWRCSEIQLRLLFRKIHRYLRDQANVGPVKTLKYTVTSFHLPLSLHVTLHPELDPPPQSEYWCWNWKWNPPPGMEHQKVVKELGIQKHSKLVVPEKSQCF
ncbi:unnamed protein product [Lactuca saligna]|uniref:Uncharacterized protein n=1 Tax=Lactuca saligna TaxID=75948 RepID=A0AA36EMJ1_LACSI|nr:unnamed protein product [Lactuca saligna]